MSYEPKEGTGALFKNDKQGNDARPDYRGDAMVNGVHVEISAWVKAGKAGKFLSLSIKPKGERQPAKEPAKGGGETRDAFGLNDEVPY